MQYLTLRSLLLVGSAASALAFTTAASADPTAECNTAAAPETLECGVNAGSQSI